MMDGSFVAVTGAGVRLPVADDLAELHGYLAKGAVLDGIVRLLGVPHTDLPQVEARVGLCPDPDAAVASRRLPRESRLAVLAAERALAGWVSPRASGGERQINGPGVGTVWVSSTAGMDEYGQVCVEAATLAPGLASPLTGPQAAYNGPAAAVSIRLSLTGPQHTMTGGRDAGATAFVEACRMLHEGQCEHVLVGGSAAVSRWRLAPPYDAPLVPAEGAFCLLLSRDGATGPGAAARPVRRSRLRPSDVDQFLGECVARLSRPPAAVVLSAPPAWRSRVERAMSTPCWHVDELIGDLGAAGGLAAIVTATAEVTADPGSALVLALGEGGNAVAAEVVSLKES